MTTPFRGITLREGVLLQGPAGWGEFSPFVEYDDAVARPWLDAALESALLGPPPPVRDRVEVNVIVPVLDPERAFALVAASGCRTAKVKIADRPDSQPGDEARVEAVRAALGPAGAIRLDANAAWDVDTAARLIPLLDRAAGGCEYVEQPCRTVPELAAVRRRVDVRIAADESIRHAADPSMLRLAGAADVAVLKSAPLGGARRALRIAESIGLPCVVSSALETAVGLAAQLSLAAALPELRYACGLGTRALLGADVVPPGQQLVPEDGFLRVPSAAPVPAQELMDAVRPAGRDREEWWLERLRRVAAGLAG
jgi:O-succinylbenzoate synthase